MSNEQNYKQTVWLRAMSDAEDEVMRTTATPCGGRKTKETIEQYVARTRQMQDDALEKYRIARQQYRENGGTLGS